MSGVERPGAADALVLHVTRVVLFGMVAELQPTRSDWWRWLIRTADLHIPDAIVQRAPSMSRAEARAVLLRSWANGAEVLPVVVPDWVAERGRGGVGRMLRAVIRHLEQRTSEWAVSDEVVVQDLDEDDRSAAWEWAAAHRGGS